MHVIKGIILAGIIALPAEVSMSSTEAAAASGSEQAAPIAIHEESTLDELLRYAAENSPEMRAAFEEWRATVERVPQARALSDPQLTYGYFVQRMNTRQAVSLSQMFPGFGKRELRGKIAEREAEVAEQRLEAARLAVFARVKSAYAELAYVEEAIQVLQEMRTLTRQSEEIALARFRAGEVGSADALRAETETERLADELATMEDRRIPAAAALNAALGRPEGAALPRPVLEEPSPLDESAGQDLESWLAANPNLRARQHEIARADAAVSLAQRESRPDFTVGIEYMENTGTAPNEVMVMAGINLPIWRQNYAAARREARAERNAATAHRQNLERDLEADLRMAFFRVRDAERQIRLHGRTLQPIARQTYDSLAGAYRAGDTDFLDLIEAQRALLDHKLLHRRAIADHMQRHAELEQLTGGTLSK